MLLSQRQTTGNWQRKDEWVVGGMHGIKHVDFIARGGSGEVYKVCGLVTDVIDNTDVGRKYRTGITELFPRL
jgi:hypothetical protein